MKTKDPRHYFRSPHMTQAEVNEFLEGMLRKEFGQQGEQMIQFTRIFRQIMDEEAGVATSSTGSHK
jgi:hypothetical protein